MTSDCDVNHADWSHNVVQLHVGHARHVWNRRYVILSRFTQSGYFGIVQCKYIPVTVVLVKSCRQSKDADNKFAKEEDAKGNLQLTICVYEQD